MFLVASFSLETGLTKDMLIQKYNMTAVIELKGKNNTEHYDEVVKSINSHKCNVVFISFHSENLEKMRKLTDVPMFFLTQKISEGTLRLQNP